MDKPITFHHDDDANVNGTSKKLTIKAPFARLLGLFGEPQRIDGDHSRVSWNIEFSDGEILTVYDWNDERRVEDVTEWNIGGRTFMVAGRIYDILAGHPIIA